MSGLEVDGSSSGSVVGNSAASNVASWTITTQSSSATTLEIGYFSPGGLNVASTAPLGPVTMQVSGSAGAAGNVVTNIASLTTRTSVPQVLPVQIGGFGQAVGDVLITEEFLGAINDGTLGVTLVDTGTTLTGDATITVIPAGALTATLQNATLVGFEIAVSGTPTSTPATIQISNLQVNVPSTVADGTNLNLLLNNLVGDSTGIVDDEVTVAVAFAEEVVVSGVTLTPDPLRLGPDVPTGVLTANVDAASPPPVPLDVFFSESTDPDDAIMLTNMAKLDDDGKAAVMLTGVGMGTTDLDLMAVDSTGTEVSGSTCTAGDPLDPTVATISGSVITVTGTGSTQFDATCVNGGPVSGYLITETGASTTATTDVQPVTDTSGDARVLVTADTTDTTDDHTAGVRATADSVSDEATVLVSAEPIAACEVDLQPETRVVDAGDTVQFSATTTGEDCATPVYTYEVTSTIGSTVTDAGLYTAGTNDTGASVDDTVTVTDTANANAQGTATVTVRGAECEVEIDPQSQTVGCGDTIAFTATVEGEDCPDVTWSISTTIGSTIDPATGAYTAGTNETGSSVTDTITATAGDATDTASVTVLDCGAECSLTIAPDPVNGLCFFPRVALLRIQVAGDRFQRVGTRITTDSADITPIGPPIIALNRTTAIQPVLISRRPAMGEVTVTASNLETNDSCQGTVDLATRRQCP
jgi:plastocyanin